MCEGEGEGWGELVNSSLCLLLNSGVCVCEGEGEGWGELVNSSLCLLLNSGVRVCEGEGEGWGELHGEQYTVQCFQLREQTFLCLVVFFTEGELYILARLFL